MPILPRAPVAAALAAVALLAASVAGATPATPVPAPAEPVPAPPAPPASAPADLPDVVMRPAAVDTRLPPEKRDSVDHALDDNVRELVRAAIATDAAPGDARATPVALGFATLAPPWAYRVAKHQRALTGGDTPVYDETLVLAPVAGPYAGRRVVLAVNVLAPVNARPGVVDQFVARVLARTQALPGTQPVRPRRVAGTEMSLVEQDVPVRDGALRVVHVVGSVLGRPFGATIVVPEVEGAPAEALLDALAIDVDTMLRMPQRLKAAEARLVSADALASAVTTVPRLPKMSATLTGLTASMDGAGRTLRASHAYDVQRARVFTVETSALTLTCLRHDDGDAPDADLMADVLQHSGVSVDRRHRDRIGALDAERFDGVVHAGGAQYSFWLADSAAFGYSVRLDSTFDKGLKGELAQGLAERPFACDGASTFAALGGDDA